MSNTVSLIKKHADAFAYVAECRASTTPCSHNKLMHTSLMIAINCEDWERVGEVINDKSYSEAFKRLVWCLNMHSTISSDEHQEILECVGEV